MRPLRGWSVALGLVCALVLVTNVGIATDRSSDTPGNAELSWRIDHRATPRTPIPDNHDWRPTIASCGPGPCSIVLGDMFTGDVGMTGTQTVIARFNAAQGTLVDLKVKMRDLTPTLAVLDGMGNEIDPGDALRPDNKGKTLHLRDFEIPWSGDFAFAIGGIPRGTGESESVGETIWMGHGEGPSDPPARYAGTFRAESAGTPPMGVELVGFEGTVFNAADGSVIAGATITVGPYLTYTDDLGRYRDRLPAGDYTAVYEAFGFMPAEEMISLMPAMPLVLDVGLEPLEAVVVEVTVDGEPVPGGMLTATATFAVLDGSEIISTTWSQVAGVPVALAKSYDETLDFTLGDRTAYKEQLFHALHEPPITEDQLPPGVELPPGEFPGGLQERFQVVGLNPFTLEETALVGLEFVVETTSGTYHGEVEIHTHLPWKPASGIAAVPLGNTVLLYGKEQDAYDWTLTPPAGSSATLMDATTQAPEFVPDVPGVYELSLFDDDMNLVTLDVYSDTWRGIIVGQDMDGRPIADPVCTGCHSAFGADQFTPWAQTGHAEIFTDNLNTSTHYGESCFSCHGVGFDPEVANGGMDDASDYMAFLGAGLINNPGDNWTEVLASYPETAMLANVQCENCHGPQGFGHGLGTPRVSLSSDDCATCHGEPLRHARFQQWQLSGHANYELAVDESQSGTCAKCHTGNGFLAWLNAIAEGADPNDSIAVAWTEDEAHPTTCQACHDPHMVGTVSGDATDATVRVFGDTPLLLAGYVATDVGNGATCMTCHNSRRGLRNDTTWPDIVGTAEAGRAPHGPTQTDLVMGENAYLVTTGNRGNHSMVDDSCSGCHMQDTPPPDILSYNQGGTNHTFYASPDICAECHEGLTADAIQGPVGGQLDMLQGMIEEALLGVMSDLVAAGNQIEVGGDLLLVGMDDVAMIADLEFGEARGRHALTFTLMDDTVIGPIRVTDIDVVQPDPMGTVALYDLVQDDVIKAGWNWLLIHNDGSLGVHNPTYAFQVLGASRGAIEALP